MRRRKAQFLGTLVYADEPQLVALRSGAAYVVALAVPSQSPDESQFFAAAVSEKDWYSYLDGNVDLRYLFTYPKTTRLFTFDMMLMADGVVQMAPWTDKRIPEEYLPLPRFFSSNHTEDFVHLPLAADKESLIIDGEWDMPEFGKFYQKYAEIYSFIVATKNWMDKQLHADLRRKIMDAFQDRPFKGGFSYVHFYDTLSSNLLRNERLSLDKIKYASPGYVDVHGRDDIFQEIEEIIPNFLRARVDIQDEYARLHGYLSTNKYLKMAGDGYPKDDPTARFIFASAQRLANKMQLSNYAAIKQLADDNALVTAKIILSFYRRLDEAAEYFAQGRMNFSDDE